MYTYKIYAAPDSTIDDSTTSHGPARLDSTFERDLKKKLIRNGGR